MNAQMKMAKCCDAATALERARNLYGTGPRYNPYPPAPNTTVLLKSERLATELA